MRKIVIGLLLFIVSCGSGGGGGGGSGDSNSTPTPTGTTFDLSKTSSPKTGTNSSVNLTGSTSSGATLSGVFQFIYDGQVVFESQNLYKTRSYIYLKNLSTNYTVSTILTMYYYANGQFYKGTDSSGITYTPNPTYNSVPDTAKVGDFGELGNMKDSDGYSYYGTWRLEAGYNGQSIIHTTSNIKSGTTVFCTVDTEFTISATGDLLSLKLSYYYPSTNVTITLTGNP